MKFKYYCFFALTILLENVSCNTKSPQVEVEQGVLEGKRMRTSTGVDYSSFKGIPFAKPPLGQLRFKAPEPPSKWEGVRKADTHGPVCIQYSSYVSNFIYGSENCLYLNVYSPNLKSRKPLAVMVWIHGGGFITGSGNTDFYSPDFLMGHDVVLVTINYRLDTLGFLALDTKDIPGNAGLKDIVAALQWVQKNIDKFGGDPDNVTIFGHAAGAACVTYLMVSPLAKGLFKRAIPMSGVFYFDFTMTFAHRERAFALGRKFGIYTDDVKVLANFLQDVPAEDLVRYRPDIMLNDNLLHQLVLNTYFGPIIEKDVGGYHFLTKQPGDLIKNNQFNDVDLFIGHTKEYEGLFTTILLQDIILENYPKYKQLFVPPKIARIISPSRALELGDEIEKFYFCNGSVTLTNIPCFVEYNTFAHYLFDIVYFIKNLPLNTEANRYVYVFSITSSRNVFSKPGAERYGIVGPTHRDDLPYLFDGEGYNLTDIDVKSKEYEYVELECRIMTNFAKYGDPTPDKSLDVTWPKFDKRNLYVEINEKLKIGKIDFSGSLGFWFDIYRKAGVEPYVYYH